MIIKWYILSSKSKNKIKLCNWLLMGRSKYRKGGQYIVIRYFDPGVKISWGSKYRLTPALASLVTSQVVNYSLRCRRWRPDGTLAALCSSVPKSSTENTLHVEIYDNLLHSLSDVNDTTCPWPLRGTVADLAAFVVAGGALSCFMTAGGAAGDDGAEVGDLRWHCGLSIYHDRFTCVCDCIVQFYLQMYSMYIYRINDFWFWFWFWF